MKRKNLKDLSLHVVLGILLAAILVSTFIFVILPNYTKHGETITVPDLIGQNIEDLEEEVIKRKLRYEVNDSVFSQTDPPLTILRQYPKPGSKVKEGRKILISVNRVLPPTIPLPAVVDRPLSELKIVLQNNDLKINMIKAENYPHYNLVLRVELNGKTINPGQPIPKGSALDIVVGDGAGKHLNNMPDVVFIEYKTAVSILKAFDLNIEPLNIKDKKDTSGLVLYVNKQYPNPDSLVKIGEWVKLWVDSEIDSTFYKSLHIKPDTAVIERLESNSPVDNE